MKTTFYYITVLFITLNTAFCQNTMSLTEGQLSPKGSLSDISWIEGHWRGEAFDGITEEIWSPPLGNSMMCVFKLLVNGKVSFYETVIILEEKGTLILKLKHFDKDLKGWETKDETVDFPLVKVDGNRVFFDGLTFERVHKDEINVYVVLSSNGKEEEVTFNYKRYSGHK
ncbi:hypothetical protein GWK08_09260 [Leptobacterium flavescens]|uniref:DUF6265 domain-containing protein n=1 Tax=Leptobacterium flavescens TaxID=472055 RepID=A0A6P0UK71_9FLAO|nr:DUF6265 family protein [Leptobacterium flavescens]NER13624.1 hypothetical protein [Leptobacterium flavescens]